MIFTEYAGFEFSSCLVRTRTIIGFTAQRWSDSDSLEQRPTAVFFYYPAKSPEKKWGVRPLGEATGVCGCAVFKPTERWVFVCEDGEVYVVGQGDDDWEARIDKNPKLFFSNVKSIRNGNAFAVGPNRKVYVRRAPGKWTKLEAGLFPASGEANLKDAGFSDIDGFSEEDAYVCGGRGDLWHYNGKAWSRVETPTSAPLKNICCAADGNVYVTTGSKEILFGRGEAWRMIEQQITDEVLEGIVDYRGQVLVSTVSQLLSVTGDGFRPAEMQMPDMRSKAHIAAGDGILVVAGPDEAAMYDGSKWSTILTPGS